MFFLNFGLAQFLVLASAASLATVALYLLDRSRRREAVSTLRFWTQARQPVQTSRRRKVQQPWSLVLQLLGIFLLLLAMAQPRIGAPAGKADAHVLVLETSAWMAARNDRGALMDRARSRARQWLAALPPDEPVMLVRADALATPATAFETDHRRIAAAIAESAPGATSLDIAGGLAFARRALTLQGLQGDIAFVGSGRIKDLKDEQPVDGAGLRVMLIPDAIENAGLRRVNARRSATDPSQWDVLVTVHNYGPQPRALQLAAGFNKTSVGSRRLTLAPGADQDAAFTFHSGNSGVLEARVSPGDAYPEDDRVTLMIPANPVFPVIVYTSRPEVLRPFLSANPRVNAQFRTPAQYRPDGEALVILDRFAPSQRPMTDTIWIDPRPPESPIPIVKSVPAPGALHWNANSVIGAGLRAHDSKIARVSVLQPSPGDIRVAEVAEGPVVLARPGAHKMVVLAFDPGAPGSRYELSSPLAFANILRWMNPESFLQLDVNVQSAGSVSAPIDSPVGPGDVKITRDDGSAIPFTLDHHTLRFFDGARENVRVQGPNRESSYALTLPEMWDVKWQPPVQALRGLGSRHAMAPKHSELWPWLAALGTLLLAADWVVFSGIRRNRVKATPMRSALRKAS